VPRSGGLHPSRSDGLSGVGKHKADIPVAFYAASSVLDWPPVPRPRRCWPSARFDERRAGAQAFVAYFIRPLAASYSPCWLQQWSLPKPLIFAQSPAPER
jgi:hypothetical protein